MAESRLIADFKKIRIKEHDGATIREGRFTYHESKLRDEDTLYVVRLSKAKKNSLLLYAKWPEAYQSLVDKGKVVDFVSIPDDTELLAEPKTNNPLSLNGIKPYSILANKFEYYAKFLDGYCKKEIERHSKENEEEDNEEEDNEGLPLPESPSSHHYGSTNHYSTRARSKSEGSKFDINNDGFPLSLYYHQRIVDDEDYGDSKSTPYSTFSQEEEKRISNFFGSDLVYSVKKLDEIFRKEERKQDSDNSSPSDESDDIPIINGRDELNELITKLKKDTPNKKPTEITEEELDLLGKLNGIKRVAQGLEEKLELNGMENCKKWMYRIIGAIVLALSGLIGGLKVGGPVGAAVGVVIGLPVGYKLGNRIGNFFSPVRAKAEHSETINKAVKKIIPK